MGCLLGCLGGGGVFLVVGGGWFFWLGGGGFVLFGGGGVGGMCFPFLFIIRYRTFIIVT